ncbi:MAG: septation protein SepH [Nitriliruptorales bacterium]|nr:septation protein SepH [Nitriliruptorales bacterium]
MIDLQFVGYTADLQHLVFDLRSGTGEGRYRLLVDADLFATMDALRDARRAEGLTVGDDDEFEWYDDWDDEEWEDEEGAEPPDDESDVDDGPAADDASDGSWLGDEDEDWLDEDSVDDESPGDDLDAREDADAADDDELAEDVGALEQPAVDEPDGTEEAGDADDGPDDDDAVSTHVVDDKDPEQDRVAAIRARAARPGIDARAADGPALSPLEIQALLRQGRSVRSVAKAANTTVDWVENWVGPIEAERQQILTAARRVRLERARLGRSRDPMGGAVERHLRDRGIDPNDVTWEAARRKDGRWRVSASFVHRRRRTRASWLFDPAAGTLSAANDAGNDLGFTRRKQRA